MSKENRQFWAGLAATAFFALLALAFPGMSRALTIPGALFSFGLTVYFLLPEIGEFISRRIGRMVALIGMVVCGIGFVGFAIWYFQPISAADTSHPQPTSIASLYLECAIQPFPIDLPSNGTVSMLLLNDMTGNTDLSEQTFMHRKTWDVGSTKFGTPTLALGCHITNYGDDAIFDVALPLSVEFRKTLETSPHSFTEGELTSSRDCLLNIGKIDPGATNPFTFYVVNVSDKTVIARFSDHAEARTIKNSAREKVLVKVPEKTGPSFIMVQAYAKNGKVQVFKN